MCMVHYSYGSWQEEVVIVFFKQKSAYDMLISDWSSDVCSSDLSFVGDGVCNPTVAHQIAVPDAISLVDARLVLAKEFGRSFPILPPPGRWDFFKILCGGGSTRFASGSPCRVICSSGEVGRGPGRGRGVTYRDIAGVRGEMNTKKRLSEHVNIPEI